MRRDLKTMEIEREMAPLNAVESQLEHSITDLLEAAAFFKRICKKGDYAISSDGGVLLPNFLEVRQHALAIFMAADRMEKVHVFTDGLALRSIGYDTRGRHIDPEEAPNASMILHAGKNACYQLKRTLYGDGVSHLMEADLLLLPEFLIMTAKCFEEIITTRQKVDCQLEDVNWDAFGQVGVSPVSGWLGGC